MFCPHNAFTMIMVMRMMTLIMRNVEGGAVGNNDNGDC